MTDVTLDKMHLLLWYLILVNTFIFQSTGSTKVFLADNGYSNLLVAIAPTAPKHQAQTIIDNIKTMIRQASPVLYKATRDRVYFKGVHILIPETWNHIEANLTSWEIFEKADVRIDSSGVKDRPYTIQHGGCGEAGLYIHFSPDYITTLTEEHNIKKYGKPGKVFVHEWAHHRYGVFDEYGEAGDPKHPLFYRRQGSSKIYPNICTNIQPIFYTRDINTNGNCQIDKSTQIYDGNCRYYFNKAFEPQTSLASYHNPDSVEYFCSDDQMMSHNYDAPTPHNSKCGSRSTWSVIINHADFADNKVKPVDLSRMDTDFEIVRPIGSRFVLVMDVSGSMELWNRMGKLIDSARRWIKNDVPNGSKVGIVRFSSMANIVSELTLITDMASRLSLMNQITNETFAATCIGCGLTLASKMLREDSFNQGGTILLITDGENSPGYYDICHIQPELVKSNVRVITIAFGTEADKNIEQLADATDGKSYYVRDQDTSESISDAFQGALTFQSDVSVDNFHVKLFEKRISSNRPQLINDTFTVDQSVGDHLKLIVVDLKPSSIESMFLVSPQGQLFNQTQRDLNTVTVHVENAEAGRWELGVQLNSTETDRFTVVVTSRVNANESASIKTKCWVQNGGEITNAKETPVRIYAQVWKGDHPVAGASVRAYVEKPNEELEVIDLYDNGVNADTSAGDGIYSRFFTNVTYSGRYSVKCQVWDDGSAYVSYGFIGSSIFVSDDGGMNNGGTNSHRSPRNARSDGSLIANFTRIEPGGSFKVDIPVSKEDAYPPGPITDLTVVSMNQVENDTYIQLLWTAPGDDMDTGKVSSYLFKYSDSATELFDFNFDNSSLSSDVPIEPNYAGSPESIVLKLSNCQKGTTYFIALRAVDKAQQFSRVSNIASFYIPAPVLLIEYVDDEVLDQSSLSDYNLSIGIGVFIGCLTLTTVLFFVLRSLGKSKAEYRYVPTV